VTGNHPTSTGPISIAASRTQVLVSITLVPRRMQLGFQAIPKNLMHRIRNRYRLQCNKNSRLCPRLAFTGEAGVSQVNNVRTLVRAFREFPDEVLGIFRITSFWFRD
jgi:hypothetical protein